MLVGSWLGAGVRLGVVLGGGFCCVVRFAWGFYFGGFGGFALC